MSCRSYREEEAWSLFDFGQPYAAGLDGLREVLEEPGFDPAVLWQWGTMQATAVIRVLEACEREFGGRGQEVVCAALREVGLDVGRQILSGITGPGGMSEAEFVSFFATVINRICYVSLEEPSIDSEEQVSFDITWCPHQEYYGAFDCRVQRYFVQGMLDAAGELEWYEPWQVRFTQTIPAGAETCRFVLRKDPTGDDPEWAEYSRLLEKKALDAARAPRRGPLNA